MMVYFFQYSKKKNSTIRPNDNAGSSFDVNLKEDTTLINPVLVMTANTSGMPNPFKPGYFNYAHIPTFDRYYFITDVQYILGHWEFYLTVDVLASFKTNIGALSEYVVRSSSAFDGSITDTIYPTNTGISKNKDLFSLSYSTTGLYVVGIINKSSNSVDGCVTYYMMTNAEIGSLKSYLMSDTFLSANGLANLTEMSSDLVKAVFNPFQYIVSCRFFPLDYDTVTTGATAVTSVEIGWWSISLSTKRMPSGFYADFDSNVITVGSHPQAASRGDYLNHAPYTERVVIHPLTGTVSIDPNKITGGQSIKISTRVDFTTGAGEVYIENATEQITLYRTSVQIAVDVQLAQIVVDHLAVTQSAVNTVSGAVGNLLSGNVAGAISSAATGVLSSLAASQPVMQTSGTNGNRSVFHIAAAMYSYYKLLVNEDLAHRGRPLCQSKTINTLSGFIMCSDAHAEIPCFDEERQQIVNYMNTGFYYE